MPQTQRRHVEIDRLPITILGAEVHNSSTSTPTSTRRAFGRAKRLGANAVLAPIAWDLLEPNRGEFHFEQIDAMLSAARDEHLYLVPLWFGSWKNASSSYVPEWIKRDPDTFPVAVAGEQGPIEHVSPFGEESRRADAAAFTALMSYLRHSDPEGTVIMVQVENEVGLLGDSRDRSDLANRAWAREVPAAIITAIEGAPWIPAHQRWLERGRLRSGSWQEVLGDNSEAHEVFMASAYATYVQTIVSSGQAQHPLPMYVNAWLDVPIEIDLPVSSALAVAGGAEPGWYPSGGPIPRVAPIWSACAPSLALHAPDIYFGDFDEICRAFRESSSALLIPEMRRSSLGAAQMLVALTEHRAVGVSPFGVDSVEEGSDAEAALADGYRLAGTATEILREHPGAVARGFLLGDDRPEQTVQFGEFLVTLKADDLFDEPDVVGPAHGAVIQERPGVFTVIGRGLDVKFARENGGRVGILAATELDFKGSWRVVRRLNGDETASGTAIRVPQRGARTPEAFPIPLLPASTGIVRVELY